MCAEVCSSSQLEEDLKSSSWDPHPAEVDSLLFRAVSFSLQLEEEGILGLSSESILKATYI